ncbi:MAG: hypothetical protein ACLR4W_01535 [Oscillospiraceae bacterium]
MGIYQLYFLKMHSKLLFLSRNAGTKDPAFLSRVLADTLAAAKEAMRGVTSPTRHTGRRSSRWHRARRLRSSISSRVSLRKCAKKF